MRLGERAEGNKKTGTGYEGGYSVVFGVNRASPHLDSYTLVSSSDNCLSHPSLLTEPWMTG